MAFDWRLAVIKIRRCLRRMFPIAVETFLNPIINPGQMLTLAASVVGTLILLRLNGRSHWHDQADQWFASVYAFGIVGIGWALICLLLSPFLAVAADRRRGRWHNRSFLYREPILVGTFKFNCAEEATFDYDLGDCEIGAMVSCSAIIAPAQLANHVVPQLHGELRLKEIPQRKSWAVYAVPPSRRGSVTVHPTTISIYEGVLRIYCERFDVRLPDRTGYAPN